MVPIICVFILTVKAYNEVYGQLTKDGYGVEHYNGGNNNILEVEWG
jgi:hypothetical protein